MVNDGNLAMCLGKAALDADLLGLYETSDSLYHYTSPDGLLGILKETGPVLWFSQYDSLNDMTEGIHILEVYQTVCKELFDSSKIDSAFYQAIYDVKPMKEDIFLSHLEQLIEDENPTDITHYCQVVESQKYVCCFSKNPDSLPMWNYYTKGDKYEGYNIGFCFWRTRESDMQNCYGKGYNFDLFTVIYDDEEKKNIIRNKIEEIYSFYKKVTMEKNALSEIQNALSYYLKSLGLKFKQNCFQHEQEVRAILTVPNDSTKFPVKYRSKAGYIIPYVEVEFPKESISGITVGPLLNDKVAEKNIQQFAKAYNYPIKDKDIQVSNIPIRY